MHCANRLWHLGSRFALLRLHSTVAARMFADGFFDFIYIDSTRHHDVVALGRLQKFALEHNLLDKPVFGKLEKPRVGQRERVPTLAETEAILARGSPAFRLIYSALRQCGARPNELCRATIADVDRVNRVITLRGCEKIEPGGLPN